MDAYMHMTCKKKELALVMQSGKLELREYGDLRTN